MHRTHTYTAQLSPSVHSRLAALLEQQRLLYNAAPEERMGAYRKAGQSTSLYDQHKSLTVLREAPEFRQYDLTCQRSARSDRRHVCPACGLSIDRDWNAARNILNRGLEVSPPTGGNTPCGAAGAENGSVCYYSP